MFAVVARAPTGRLNTVDSDVSCALPLVQRVGDGLAVFSEYGRALAAGPGPLSVEVSSDDESSVYYRPGDFQGAQLIRWVWTDGKSTLGTNEEATMRSGPILSSFVLGPKNAFRMQRRVGYLDAVLRDGSVLALERGTHTVQGAYIGSTAEELSAAHVAVLSGKGGAPALPADVCPDAMAAGADGALLIVVEKCADATQLGLLRYAPQKTSAAPIKWVTVPAVTGTDRLPVALAVVSDHEMYVGHDTTLVTWDGKAWTDSKPFGSDNITSLSAGVDGALWAIAGEGVSMRKPGASKWDEVALPELPTDPLDDAPYTAPSTTESVFRKQPVASPGNPGKLAPRFVDAAGAEILIAGTTNGELFVLSNKPRSPIARIPSIDAQRAQLAKAYAHKPATGKSCFGSFLLFPQGTKPESLVIAADAGESLGKAEAIVEGKTELVVYSKRFATDDDVIAAAKQFKSLAPKRVCGAPVIEKDL